MTSTRTDERPVDEPTGLRTRAALRLYCAVIGLAALAVLLQGLWAGLFVHEGKDYQQSWVEVHARGADLAILLAAVATAVAFVRLRERRDLLVGAAVR